MDDEKLRVLMIDVWALCDALYNRLNTLGEVSPSFKDGFLVATQYLSHMVADLEDELERANHDATILEAIGK